MSTRATIKIKQGNDELWVYHHCDGYPDGVGCDLKKYLGEKTEWNASEIHDELIEGKLCGITHNIWTGTSTRGDDGYEETDGQHGDEDYGYLIDCDNQKLVCYKLGWDEFVWRDDKIIEL